MLHYLRSNADNKEGSACVVGHLFFLCVQALHRTILGIHSALASAQQGAAASHKASHSIQPQVVVPDESASTELQEPKTLAVNSPEETDLSEIVAGEQELVRPVHAVPELKPVVPDYSIRNELAEPKSLMVEHAEL